MPVCCTRQAGHCAMEIVDLPVPGMQLEFNVPDGQEQEQEPAGDAQPDQGAGVRPLPWSAPPRPGRSKDRGVPG
jgi:hypothetical protein